MPAICRANALLRFLFSLSLFCSLFLLVSDTAESETSSETEVNQPSDKVSEDPVELFITANRHATSLDKTGSSLTVISSEEIRDSNQPSLLEVLRRVEGLEVVRTGAPGGATSVFIRGAESDHTLVLIDGVRANSNATGLFDFANLTTDNIERVEIIRGPQSVLYGSEAIGGVINVITKSLSLGTSASFAAEGGSFGTQNYRANVGQATDSARFGLNISYQNSDGFSTASESAGNTEDDSYENLALSGRAGASFLEDGEVDLTVRYVEGDAELDGFDFESGPVDALNFEQDSRLLTSALVVSKPLRENVKFSLSLGMSRDELEGSDLDNEFNNFEIDSSTSNITSSVEIKPDWEGLFLLGHSFEKRRTDNRDNFDEKRDVNSFFLQKQLSLDSLPVVSLGVRHDDDSDFGDETTFRTTMSWSCNCDETTSRIHASFGTGFKAPSFNELYFPNFGNPDLDAEKSWGYDVGWEFSLPEQKAVLDVTFFQSSIEDLITFDAETFLAANIDEADMHGIEASLRYQLNRYLGTRLNYTWTDAEDATTGEPLARRPEHKGRIGLTSEPIDGLNLGLSLLIVDGRVDSDGSKMDDYQRVDFTGSWQLRDSIRPYFRIDNLFDEDYEEVTGYETTGLAAYGGVEFLL